MCLIPLDQQEWLGKMLNNSPQMKYAQPEADRATAVLSEARREPIPDIQFSANVSEDNEPLEPSTKRAGIVSGVQIGMQLPLFNRNQCNITKARAEVERSNAEIHCVQLDLARQVSSLFRDYAIARTTADRYRSSLLPRAQKAYELYRDNYQNMAASYPQALIAQKTFFQLQVDYINSLETAWRHFRFRVTGYLTDWPHRPRQVRDHRIHPRSRVPGLFDDRARNNERNGWHKREKMDDKASPEHQ